MTPDDPLTAGSLTQRAWRMLRAIDSSPIAAMDAPFYAHHIEELRLIVETFLDDIQRAPAAPGRRVWLVWDCDDPVACFTTEHQAIEACADLQHRLMCEYAPSPKLMESISISTALLEPACCATAGPPR
ncbi:hypothetical protein [Calidifontibacter indicus]|uniref:hypothetical protein n=1 Tax=Calidifontibacter indicus TaxID=419650 RepID=UPI003D703658